MNELKVGDVIEVGIESWAGRTWCRAVILKVCPKRLRVQWRDVTPKRVVGDISYVPKRAARRSRK